jgi:hypothetical protein
MVAAGPDLHRRRRACDVADRLAAPLKAGKLTDADLQAIQDRRTFPAKMTQRIQLTMQNRIIGPALQGKERPKPPLLFKLMDVFPALRRIPARLLGLGVRPEHIQTPEAAPLA